MIDITTDVNDKRFKGLDATMRVSEDAITIVFGAGSSLFGDRWAGISFRMGEAVSDLNFFKVADKIETHRDVNLEEAIAIVRAAKAKEAA